MQTIDRAQIRYFASSEMLMMEQPSERLRDSTDVLFDFVPLKYHLNSGVQKSWFWHADDCVLLQVDSDAYAVRKTKLQASIGEHLL